jgi:diguanylate cyclase (GGDEF)-like protein
MRLDVNTLFLVTIYVETILGLLLLFAWIQNPKIHGVAWWGFAYLMRAGSVALYGLFGSAPDIISIDIANAALFISFAMTWAGARVFDGRRPLPLWLFGGAIMWLGVSHVPALTDQIDVSVLISSGIITSYLWMAAFELWAGRKEALVSRWPAIFLLFAHGALFLLQTPVSSILPWLSWDEVFSNVWMTALSFETLLFTIAIAFVFLAMAKERIELRHKRAASIDHLTGMANRRAFLQDGTALMQRQQIDGCATAVLLIDLDHFKAVNDRFGHAVGDRVLQIFAEASDVVLRQRDLIGRLGGEEFAAVLYDVKPDEARSIADDLRVCFARFAYEVDGRLVAATASIGIVINEDPTFDVPGLLALADQALYQAKARGRNRVEVAGLDLLMSAEPPRGIDARTAA